MSQTLTLQSLPLFPLGTVLFPGGYLPLQIFEVRYLNMVGTCQRTGAPFGVVTLRRGSEVMQAPSASAGPDTSDAIFHPIGTIARIGELDRPRPGLMLIQCTGLQRFRVSHHHLLSHGLWVADVTLLPADQTIPIPEDLKPIAVTLRRVIETLSAQGTPAAQMPIHQPYQFDDCAWVANRWCELLPLALDLKTRLMSLDNPLLRLELVGDLLERHGITPGH